MPRYYPGSDITLELQHTDAAGVLVNADSVTVETKLNDCEATTSTPTNVSPGIYQIIVTPKDPGVLFAKWKITENGINTVQNDKVKVHHSEFEEE